MMRIRSLALLIPALLFSASLLAATPEVQLQIKDRGFVPAQLEVPANTKIKLVIHNADKFPAEFESYDLSREVVVPGGGEVTVYVGPLDKGEYKFFNDFHLSSKGVLTAR